MNDRQLSVCIWAKSHIDARDFVIIDTETTGLDTTAEIVSIAVVNAWGKVAFSSLARPYKPIDEIGKAFAVNGISNAMLKNAPLLGDVWPMAAKHIGTSTVISYNADFDCRMVVSNLGLEINGPFRSQWECAMLQYAEYFGEVGTYGDFRWHRLEVACAREGVITSGLHDAANDALATYLLMEALAAKVVE